jgi:hypothetical protein
LTVYPRHHLITSSIYNYPDFQGWDDPAEYAGRTPDVYKNNSGSLYSDGVIYIPAYALILHGGGPSGNDYSHVVWTAPTSGGMNVWVVKN